MVDYTEMSEPDFLDAVGDDASKWAAAFCQTAAKLYPIGLFANPEFESWMLSWFANAIEHSHDLRTGGGPVRLPDGSGFFVS